MEDRCPICMERLYGGECNQRHKNNLVWERTAYWSKWDGLGIDTFQIYEYKFLWWKWYRLKYFGYKPEKHPMLQTAKEKLNELAKKSK